MPHKHHTLKTERLILNELKPIDIPQIVKYAGNKNIAKNTLNIPHPYAEKDAEFWIHSAKKGRDRGTQFTFAIRLIPKNEFIGGIGLKVERRFDRAEMGY